MFKISTHIMNEIGNKDIHLVKIEVKERMLIREDIRNNYVDSRKHGELLWEKLSHYESIQDADAWSYIKEFIDSRQCIMLFNQNEEEEMFLFDSGMDLDYVLTETYGFEFYVTDRRCSFLLCFNHHDILYGCGTAENWIKTLKAKK